MLLGYLWKKGPGFTKGQRAQRLGLTRIMHVKKLTYTIHHACTCTRTATASYLYAYASFVRSCTRVNMCSACM